MEEHLSLRLPAHPATAEQLASEILSRAGVIVAFDDNRSPADIVQALLERNVEVVGAVVRELGVAACVGNGQPDNVIMRPRE